MLNHRREDFIEKTAKRPRGRWALKHYAHPRAHFRSFGMIMDALDLSPKDKYCEIGCGGGVLLNMAMEKAGTGAAVDHSPDMVQLSIQANRKWVDEGRLEVVQGSAEALPWETGRFTACSCANMFFFVDKPWKALTEIYRVLAPGGRFSMVTAGNSIVTRITFGRLYRLNLYSDRDMVKMMRAAGFEKIWVNTGRIGIFQVCWGEKS